MPLHTRSTYDVVPYKTHPIAQSHPARLATIAYLLGLESAKVEHCRVLEIGCASGENLLPLADNFPNSKFVGIDLSAVQISTAQKRARSLGFDNIEFIHGDLRDLSIEHGKYDFVIAHGVYSWVSSDVQQALLMQCRRHLARHGVAYVSYNTHPGWHMRKMIRDMMNYRVRNISAPAEQIRQARELLHFLAECVDSQSNAYGILLNTELKTLNRQYDSYLYHEHLERENNPVYFHEFHERSAAAGLQYLGEADFTSMFVEVFPERVQTMLRSVASTLVEAEQYMDFVRNRTFRQTLLCNDSVEVDRSLPPHRVNAMSLSSPTQPASLPVVLDTDEAAEFRVGASTATTSDPLTKAALLCLGEAWPNYLTYSSLLASARQKLAAECPSVAEFVRFDETQLAKSLLSAYANGHIELTISPPHFVSTVTEKPRVSRLARYQAKDQHWVTNQMHVDVQLNDFERQLLMRLDGQQDFASLAIHVDGLAEYDEIAFTSESCTTPESATHVALRRLANLGLLIG